MIYGNRNHNNACISLCRRELVRRGIKELSGFVKMFDILVGVKLTFLLKLITLYA